MPDQLTHQLARLFRRARQPTPATVELRLLTLEKRIDVLETRLWAMVAAVAVAELLRVLLGK